MIPEPCPLSGLLHKGAPPPPLNCCGLVSATAAPKVLKVLPTNFLANYSLVPNFLAPPLFGLGGAVEL